ncbi:hypothetical protein [Photobacterium leiognathi]|uniref:hypothetical protein n=1 Tax=Photobacterium leiognathi TaxID=553611 RepID=UPI002980F0A6|nr:hypothetical protein [Photobacterium leiognathi]
MKAINSLNNRAGTYIKEYGNQENNSIRTEKKFVGNIGNLKEITPTKDQPNAKNVAMQGEGVFSCFDSNKDNYLMSLNAQTCIITTLYNLENKSGVVLHFDNNIKEHIEKAIREALALMDVNDSRNVSATLSGGVWFLGGDDIANPIKMELNANNIKPSHDEWSFSPCTEHYYGAILNLKDGSVKTFETPLWTVKDFFKPILNQARHEYNENEINIRANNFMTRFSLPAISESKSGKCTFVDNNTSASKHDIAKHSFQIHSV